MEFQSNQSSSSHPTLEAIREVIAGLQSLDLDEHCDAYDGIHSALGANLTAIDGA